MASDTKRSAGIVVSGLADEAGDAIESQLKAHLELDWKSIELRMVNGRMLTTDLNGAEFDHALAQIDYLGFKVEAVASAIGNWSRSIDGDFAVDVHELETAIPRMRRLGTRFMRTMSWTRGAATEREWRDEAVRRYRVLAAMAEAADIVMLHENCAGWGGQSAAHMCEFVDAVGSPAVAVLFDIGNTISHGYQPWEFYQGLKGRIRYVHIKDCRRNPAGGRSADYAYPGEGDAMVPEILADLIGWGYRGTISIEPHIAAVIHTAGKKDPARCYSSYLDYARRVMAMIDAMAVRPSGARV
jgi:sugar phosphate isomerase/epimerase